MFDSFNLTLDCFQLCIPNCYLLHYTTQILIRPKERERTVKAHFETINTGIKIKRFRIIYDAL